MRNATLAVALLLALAFAAAAQAAFLPPVTVTPMGADPFGYPSDVGFDQAGNTTVSTVSAGNVLVYNRPFGGSFSGGQLGPSTKASMAVSANGSAVLVSAASATSVKVYYRSTPGGAFTAAATYTTAAVGFVAAGIDASGNAVVSWVDSGIHYALSSSGTFGSAQLAPLGATPGFEGRNPSDAQRDFGPRAFRDNAGNIVLVYLDGSTAKVAHRSPAGAWDTTSLPGTANDVKSAADPVSQHLIVGYTTASNFLAVAGQTTASAGVQKVSQTSSAQPITSVAVQPGGSADLVLWRDGAGALQSAGSADGYTPTMVALSNGGGGGAAVTTAGNQIAYYVASPGIQRAVRAPGGSWVSTGYAVSNFGTGAIGSGYNGEVLDLFVDFPSDTGITGLPYCDAAAANPTCAPLAPAPGPGPGPAPTPTTTTPAPTPTATTATTPTPAPVPPPVRGRTANVRPVSGKVSVRLPGARAFTALTGLASIPVGTTVNASTGRVQVSVDTPKGRATTDFYDGEFILTQAANGIATLTLTGGDFSVCPVPRRGARLASAARAKAAPTHVVRKLWGDGHGSFMTKGRYGSATVRGTIWLTQDQCDGTLIKVASGIVQARDIPAHKQYRLSTGKRHLARSPVRR